MHARRILREMKPEGVLDELGFLVLSGVLSDRLYPRLSTIMTRARYFIFVPAICRSVEGRTRSVRQNAEAVVRRMQVSLCLELLKTGPDERGVIGGRKKGNVVRSPSSVYWNSLNELGIGAGGLSEAAYYGSLASLGGAGLAHDDDGGALEIDGETYWNLPFPSRGIVGKLGIIEPGISLQMTACEAEFLRRMMLEREAKEPLSLLGWRLERDRKLTSPMRPAHSWEFESLPEELQRVVHHAKCLSLFARGAQLQYHAMLFAKRDDLTDVVTYSAFDAWWSHAKKTLANWDLNDFQALIEDCRRRSKTAPVAKNSFEFLRNWRHIVTTASKGGTAYSDEAARDLLRRREEQVRGGKARMRPSATANAVSYLQEWRPLEKYDPAELYALDYRHRVGNAMVADIADGLENGL
jgi:hypothetical protein